MTFSHQSDQEYFPKNNNINLRDSAMQNNATFKKSVPVTKMSLNDSGAMPQKRSNDLFQSSLYAQVQKSQDQDGPQPKNSHYGSTKASNSSQYVNLKEKVSQLQGQNEQLELAK